jgi:ADP-heptose:LPS heptosyltransferase
MSAQEHILVIKHGALGDIVLATGPMTAIRAHHPQAHITLLTAKPYDTLLKSSPYFDEIWVDAKPKVWQFAALQKLRRLLNSRPFLRVYDLQTSQRSTSYYQLFRHKPQWSGLVPGEFVHDTPHRTQSHTLDREREQLNLAGIHDVPGPDVSWLTSDISRFSLPERYVVLIPGGSAHRPEKRWPQAHYAELAVRLQSLGITPVLIGTDAEARELSAIQAACPEAINLCSQTSFADLAELGRGALACVGNDTGPMHLVAVTQCPSVVLFSRASNPAMCAPRGEKVTALQRDALEQLSVDEVFSTLKPWLRLDRAA